MLKLMLQGFGVHFRFVLNHLEFLYFCSYISLLVKLSYVHQFSSRVQRTPHVQLRAGDMSVVLLRLLIMLTLSSEDRKACK